LRLKTRQSSGDGYFCQATELHRAGTPLRIREVHEHVRALWKEDVNPLDLARSFAICVHDIVQWTILGAEEWTTVPGTCVAKTPSTSLNLRPGERVRVKSRAEILATLDAKGWNRGMEFSREMLLLRPGVHRRRARGPAHPRPRRQDVEVEGYGDPRGLGVQGHGPADGPARRVHVLARVLARASRLTASGRLRGGEPERK
jgi:hypothetical protein